MWIDLDRVLNEKWTVGAAYNIGNTRLSYNTIGDSATVESHQLGTYGRYTTDEWTVNGGLGYSKNNYNTARRIVIGNKHQPRRCR